MRPRSSIPFAAILIIMTIAGVIAFLVISWVNIRKLWNKRKRRTERDRIEALKRQLGMVEPSAPVDKSAGSVGIEMSETANAAGAGGTHSRSSILERAVAGIKETLFGVNDAAVEAAWAQAAEEQRRRLTSAEGIEGLKTLMGLRQDGGDS